MTATLCSASLSALMALPPASSPSSTPAGLLPPDGELVAVVVCQERLAVHAGIDAPWLAHALGSVGEPIAHRVPCSVLVVPAASGSSLAPRRAKVVV